MTGPSPDPYAPFLCDLQAVARARKLVICAPGVLTRVSIFDPVKQWRSQGWEPVFYPFPGLDGRALSPALDVGAAARSIAALVQAQADKQICLLGFSTGGAIMIEAAALLGGAVKVAAIAPGLPRAGGWATMQATTRDVLAAAWRCRSLAVRRVWLEYYRVLLVGRAGLDVPERAALARAITAERAAHMVYPEGGLLRAHVRGLRRWSGPGGRLQTPRNLSLFIGGDDPVFSTQATRAFAKTLGEVRIREYPDHGHMLFVTHPGVFDDVLAFFSEADHAAAKQTGLSD